MHKFHKFHQFSLRTLIAAVSGVALLLFALSFRPQAKITATLNNDGTVILNEAKVENSELFSRVDSELWWRNLWLVESSVLLTAESRNVSAAQIQVLITHLKSAGVNKINLHVD